MQTTSVPSLARKAGPVQAMMLPCPQCLRPSRSHSITATPLSQHWELRKTLPSPAAQTARGGEWSASQPPGPLAPLSQGELSFVTISTFG